MQGHCTCEGHCSVCPSNVGSNLQVMGGWWEGLFIQKYYTCCQVQGNEASAKACAMVIPSGHSGAETFLSPSDTAAIITPPQGITHRLAMILGLTRLLCCESWNTAHTVSTKSGKPLNAVLLRRCPWFRQLRTVCVIGCVYLDNLDSYRFHARRWFTWYKWSWTQEALTYNFDFTRVWKWYAFSRNCTLMNFDLFSDYGEVVHTLPELQ